MKAIECLSTTFKVSHVYQDHDFEELPAGSTSPMSFRSESSPRLATLPLEILGSPLLAPESVTSEPDSVESKHPFSAPEVEKLLVTSIKHDEIRSIFYQLTKMLFYCDTYVILLVLER